MNSLQAAFIFLVKICIDLAFFIVLLRFLFQYFRIDFYNPFSQFVLKITNPTLTPLRNRLPQIHKIDLAALLLLIVLKIAELFLVTLIATGGLPHFLSLLIWPMGEILSQTLNLFFFAILIVAILSWIAPKIHSPFTSILIQITEPLLEPARKITPNYFGIDLSPLLVLIILKFLDILVVVPMLQWAIHLSH